MSGRGAVRTTSQNRTGDVRNSQCIDVDEALEEASLSGCDLVGFLDADERFRRDTRLGGIFHPGGSSFREISPTNSLHVVIHGQQVSAHVDEVSPLVIRPDGSSRYAWGRVAAHSLLALLGDVRRRSRGHSRRRCDLRCEVEWVNDMADADAGERPAAGGG